jgi:hypothetical protein
MEVDAAAKGDEAELELVWWLVTLGREDRETYRKLRDLAWRLVEGNVDSSVKPNKLS